MLEPGSESGLELQVAGSDLDSKIDLRAPSGGASSLPVQYKQGVILSRRYDDASEGMPAEAAILGHLR
jgi:hypothetical protein